MSKYEPWDRFFAELEGDEVTYSLDEFEQRTGVVLPPVARRRAEWWSGERYWAKWRTHGWFVHTRLATGSVVFSRQPPRRGRAAHTPVVRDSPGSGQPVGDLVLVGCVAQKQASAAPARELYTSPLWHGRRSYAEASGKPWFILSAEHGLLNPDEMVAPYDKNLGSESADYRETWSTHVGEQVVEEVRQRGLTSVELHAGSAYLDNGLVDCLVASDIDVLRPLRGLRIGEQLSWYAARSALQAPTSTGEIRSTVRGAAGVTIAQLVEDIAETFRSGTLGESWDDLPEMWNLPPTSGRNRRLWVTFVAAVDRARDAARLWRAANAAWDEEPWIFNPPEVVSRPLLALAEVLRGYGLSQRHSIDIHGWRMIAEALDAPDCPKPIARAIDGKTVSAYAIRDALTATWPSGTPMWPLLSGPKVGPMWVRMLAFPGGAPIRDMDTIPVAVDTHVQRVTEMLGLVPTRSLDDRHRQAIEELWFDAVRAKGPFGAPKEVDGTTAGLDPALWALGKEGCSRCERERRKTPVGPICNSCVLGRV